MLLIGGEAMIVWLRKWNHCDQEEKILLYEYQEALMVEVLNFWAVIGRGGKDEERLDQVGTIYECIIVLNHISK